MTDFPPMTLPQPPTEDLFHAAEELRANENPDVPAELLAAVLSAESDNLDNRVAAARAVGRAIDAWLTDHPNTPSSKDAEPGGAEA